MTLIEERTLVEPTSAPKPSSPPETTRDRSLTWLLVLVGAVAVVIATFFALRSGDEAETSNHQQVIEHGSPTAVDNAVDVVPDQGFYPEAEASEREAHLAGQARTYAAAASSPASDSSGNGYLPGSRHVPER